MPRRVVRPHARPAWCPPRARQSKRREASLIRRNVLPMIFRAKANGSAYAPLVKALTEASATVLEWLTKQYGIRFELVEGVAPGHSLSRMHALADRGGATLLSSLYSALGTQGVRMQSSADVTDLVVDDSQRIMGVRYKRGSKIESVACSTLILACNGFAGNRSLVAKYLPDVRGAAVRGPRWKSG